MKNIRSFHQKNFHFLVVKFSVYLNRRVFVMNFDLLTNGSALYNSETNKQIILAVLKFMKDTNRFDKLCSRVY